MGYFTELYIVDNWRRQKIILICKLANECCPVHGIFFFPVINKCERKFLWGTVLGWELSSTVSWLSFCWDNDLIIIWFSNYFCLWFSHCQRTWIFNCVSRGHNLLWAIHISSPKSTCKPWWTLTRQQGGLDIVCGCDDGMKLNDTYRNQSCSLAPVRTQWPFLDDTAPAWLSLAAVDVQGLWAPGLPATCHLPSDVFIPATVCLFLTGPVALIIWQKCLFCDKFLN